MDEKKGTAFRKYLHGNLMHVYREKKHVGTPKKQQNTENFQSKHGNNNNYNNRVEKNSSQGGNGRQGKETI